MSVLQLELRADLTVVAETLPVLKRFCEEHAVPRRTANRLEVVFEELVSNVLRHGIAPGPAIAVRVRIEIAEAVLRLVVEDRGRPFDPTGQSAPAPLTRLADAPEGGLGIELVRRLASRFDYQRLAGDYCNHVLVELPIGEVPAR